MDAVPPDIAKKLLNRDFANLVKRVQAGGKISRAERAMLQSMAMGAGAEGPAFARNFVELASALNVSRQAVHAWKKIEGAPKAADDERVAAVLAGDGTRLKAIYSEELRYGHATGVVDDKAAYLDALASGKTKYLSWNYEERKFSFPAPGMALMTGRTRIEVGKADRTVKMVLVYQGVWREEQGQWRFLSWQSCKLPDAPAGGAAGK